MSNCTAQWPVKNRRPPKCCLPRSRCDVLCPCYLSRPLTRAVSCGRRSQPQSPLLEPVFDGLYAPNCRPPSLATQWEYRCHVCGCWSGAYGSDWHGAMYAFRANQPVVQKPSNPAKEKPIKPKPTEPIATTPAVKPEPTKPAGNKPGGKEPPEPAVKDVRIAWYYRRSPEGAQGVVYHVAGKRWKEKSSDGRSNQFTEIQRTDDAVSLKDASRNLTIWLKSNQMTYSRNGTKRPIAWKGNGSQLLSLSHYWLCSIRRRHRSRRQSLPRPSPSPCTDSAAKARLK